MCLPMRSIPVRRSPPTKLPATKGRHGHKKIQPTRNLAPTLRIPGWSTPTSTPWLCKVNSKTSKFKFLVRSPWQCTIPVSPFFLYCPFLFFYLFNLAHNMWTNPVPSLMDMPQGWPGVDTEAGLRPEHIYPQCEFFSLFLPSHSLQYIIPVVYTIHQFPARDSLGELLHDGTLPNNNLCTAEIRNPASSRAMYGKEELTTEGKLVLMLINDTH